MAAEIAKERLGFKPSTLIVAAVVVVAGGFLWWWLKQPVQYAQGPPITPPPASTPKEHVMPKHLKEALSKRSFCFCDSFLYMSFGMSFLV